MADVFISYAHEDRNGAKKFARFIEEHGYSVWWDKETQAGTMFLPEIDKQLRECKAVIVLWTDRSLKSWWVREEAGIGRFLGKIVPVVFSHVGPLRGHSQLHFLRGNDLVFLAKSSLDRDYATSEQRGNLAAYVNAKSDRLTSKPGKSLEDYDWLNAPPVSSAQIRSASDKLMTDYFAEESLFNRLSDLIGRPPSKPIETWITDD